jgi:hypothetical protein
MSRTANDLLAVLRSAAPNVAFSVTAEYDPNFRWDGDGPDPEDEGFEAHDVTVAAKAIVAGEELEGEAYLGGHYLKDGEPLGDLGGYLPQMLEEAARELAGQLEMPRDTVLAGQLADAIALIKGEMRARYDEQMAGRT